MIASRKYQIGYIVINPGDIIPEDLLKAVDPITKNLKYPHLKIQNEEGDKANKLRAERDAAKAKADKESSDNKAKAN